MTPHGTRLPWRSGPTRFRPKLRIGFVTPGLLYGGAERWIASLVAGLDRSKMRVVGVAVHEDGEQFPDIANQIKETCDVVQRPGGMRDVAEESDILLAWGMDRLEEIRGCKCRVVFVGHGHCDWTTRCVRELSDIVTDWVAVSENATQSFPDRSQVRVIYNGISRERCVQTKSVLEVRSEWGLEHHEIAIGHFGRIAEEKAPLAAAQIVRELGPPYRTVMIGGGVVADEWLAKAREIDPRLIYRPPVNNAGDVLHALDCSIHAAPSEGFSLAIAEAWLCKCPTVCTPAGAIPELEAKHGKLCVRVPVNATPKQLASAAIEAMRHDNSFTVACASTVVSEYYTEEVMCRNWSDYLVCLPYTTPLSLEKYHGE